MTKCQTYSRPVLKATHPETHEIYLFQPRCKMWKCVPCAYTNKLLWQAKIAHGYERYALIGVTNWMFITLTSHRRLKSTKQCLHVWKSAWAKLSARMRRKYPGFRYVLLPEHHKDGRVHWHMIASHGINARWLKDTAPKCGLGYMTDCQPIDDSIAAVMYVSKYVGKTIGAVEWPENLKRIRTSQHWPELPPDESSVAEIDMDWLYWLKYPAEGMGYLAYELERQTGVHVHVISK